MRTRTRNALAIGLGAAIVASGLVLAARQHTAPVLSGRALDAIPAGALLVATADLRILRLSSMSASFLQQGREIEGVGKVKDVCGFDPVDQIADVALGIPASGDSGDFGLSAAGDFDDEAILQCATRVIEKRGGRPVVVPIGGFRSVHDASQASGGEIAVRKGGPLLLGAGSYLHSMIDAAEGRTPSIRTSTAHTELARAVGDGSMRLTFVLSPEQRKALAGDVEHASTVTAGALAVGLGEPIRLHGVLACETADACAAVSRSLAALKQSRASDVGVRLVGFGALLDRLTIEPQGTIVHARVEVSRDEAKDLFDTALKLRGFRHPMPKEAEANERPERASRDAGADEVIQAKDAGPPPR